VAYLECASATGAFRECMGSRGKAPVGVVCWGSVVRGRGRRICQSWRDR